VGGLAGLIVHARRCGGVGFSPDGFEDGGGGINLDFEGAAFARRFPVSHSFTLTRQGADMTNPASADASSSLQVRPAAGYAGDVPARLALAWVQAGEAVLVDVRTDAEREWVGYVPGAVPLAWKQWPGMAMNAGFDEGLKAAVPPGKKAVLLCRSGVRSVAAAKRAAELGLEAYNILEGFEGDADEQGQRGRKGGWRFQGLPWKQG
jgi:rhodanese-related sulfurtransferase